MRKPKGTVMDNRKSRRSKRRNTSQLVKLGSLAALALAPGLGCGREFFRQWADQDVTEAVFEKSRDPRFRLPMYTIDPPAMARYADYTDPDRPAAPPDDLTAEALSPYPQKPNWRAMVPVEGTGYLDMMEDGRRYEGLKLDPKKTMSGTELPPLPGDAPPAPEGPAPFGGRAPERLSLPGTGNEFDPEENSGTLPGPLTPLNRDLIAPPNGASGRGSVPPQAQRSGNRDSQVLAASLQVPAQPVVPGGEPNPTRIPTEPAQFERVPEEPGGYAGTDGPPDLVGAWDVSQ